MNLFQKLGLLPQSTQQSLKVQTNAQPVFAQYDKKAEVILSDGRFATIHKIRVGHLLASSSNDPLQNAVKLIINSVKIDDKVPEPIDILNLEVRDFHKIMDSINS